jgi:hypothetical protein
MAKVYAAYVIVMKPILDDTLFVNGHKVITVLAVLLVMESNSMP